MTLMMEKSSGYLGIESFQQIRLPAKSTTTYLLAMLYSVIGVSFAYGAAVVPTHILASGRMSSVRYR